MSNARPKLYLGFLTVVDRASYGLIGGYLILNTAGRPLEFHCTTPVRPSRAQQILYGPTLEPYLFGEQIGQSLLSKAKLEPLAVCTDRVEVLAVREYTAVPVAFAATGGRICGADGRQCADERSRRRVRCARQFPTLTRQTVAARHRAPQAASALVFARPKPSGRRGRQRGRSPADRGAVGQRGRIV